MVVLTGGVDPDQELATGRGEPQQTKQKKPVPFQTSGRYGAFAFGTELGDARMSVVGGMMELSHDEARSPTGC